MIGCRSVQIPSPRFGYRMTTSRRMSSCFVTARKIRGSVKKSTSSSHLHNGNGRQRQALGICRGISQSRRAMAICNAEKSSSRCSKHWTRYEKRTTYRDHLNVTFSKWKVFRTLSNGVATCSISESGILCQRPVVMSFATVVQRALKGLGAPSWNCCSGCCE